MDRVSMKEHAKEQIKGKIFTLLAIYIIIAAANMVISFVLGSISGIVTLLIAGPIALAEAFIYLGITKKSRMPKIEDLLIGFKGDNFLRMLIAYLRYEVFVFLWSLLFIVPGIIKGISYSQMFYFMAEDDKLEAGAAQRKSMEIMEGHKWEYFVLQLSFIPWHLLGIITLGIAYVWIIPYIETTMAEYHVRLTGGNKPASKPAAKAAKAKEAKVKETKSTKSTKKTTKK
ncbi:DUF975 family protein [Candidatus Saccharibacteria bacterium]|nr:DUF975 family protein [Candidatus Saccharibacteria bacterium]